MIAGLGATNPIIDFGTMIRPGWVGIRTHNVKIPSGGLQKMGTISLIVLRPYNLPRVEP
ncbi:hypothetical protein LBMAG01_07220 [Acidobacteriota bacterium]|nr:hypothetical protein LBMAG01_07220 [Acidobacteriota bacterium]